MPNDLPPVTGSKLAATPLPRQVAGHMAKVLIVEDDPRMTELIQTLLGTVGHRCLITPSGQRARAFLSAQPDIDLVILDHHLETGGDNGLMILRALREIPKYAETPVLICTGDSRPEIIKEFLPLKIGAFIKKPFKPERMLADVARALSGPASADQA